MRDHCSKVNVRETCQFGGRPYLFQRATLCSLLSVLKAEARKGGMLYMQEEGLRLLVKGITLIDELLRVVK